MITITGYSPTNYKSFIAKLNECFEQSGKLPITVASEIKVKTPMTVKNALMDYQQIVSDEVLTKVMKSVGMDGFVLFIKGEKYYYVKK